MVLSICWHCKNQTENKINKKMQIQSRLLFKRIDFILNHTDMRTQRKSSDNSFSVDCVLDIYIYNRLLCFSQNDFTQTQSNSTKRIKFHEVQIRFVLCVVVHIRILFIFFFSAQFSLFRRKFFLNVFEHTIFTLESWYCYCYKHNSNLYRKKNVKK